MDDPKLGFELADIGCSLAKENHSSEANYALTKYFEICITACRYGLQDVLKVAEDAFRAAEGVEEFSWGAQSGIVGLIISNCSYL